jgi:hypothetical protein
MVNLLRDVNILCRNLSRISPCRLLRNQFLRFDASCANILPLALQPMRNEVAEVRLLNLLVGLQLLIAFFYSWDLLIVAKRMSDGMFRLAIYITGLLTLCHLMQFLFLRLLVRRESLSDLAVSAIVAVACVQEPFVMEWYINDHIQSDVLVAQRLGRTWRVVLLVCMTCCCAIFLVVVRRVYKACTAPPKHRPPMSNRRRVGRAI